MVGKRSVIAELPENYKAPQENLFFSKSGKWIPLEPGKTEPKGFGPEISFAANLSEKLGEPIGIIKVSKGGTNLAEDWNPDDPDSFYAKLLRVVNKAQQSRPIEVKGLLWVQGGADAKKLEHANAYSANLENLIERSRSDFNAPAMAFVCERIRASGGVNKPHMPIIRLVHENCPAENYAWVDGDDFEKGKDNVHYNTAGHISLGNDSAETMYRLLILQESAKADAIAH